MAAAVFRVVVLFCAVAALAGDAVLPARVEAVLAAAEADLLAEATLRLAAAVPAARVPTRAAAVFPARAEAVFAAPEADRFAEATLRSTVVAPATPEAARREAVLAAVVADLLAEATFRAVAALAAGLVVDRVVAVLRARVVAVLAAAEALRFAEAMLRADPVLVAAAEVDLRAGRAAVAVATGRATRSPAGCVAAVVLFEGTVASWVRSGIRPDSVWLSRQQVAPLHRRLDNRLDPFGRGFLASDR
ncbi:hypothetical protein [Kineosporia babensis]|uniref:Uncharacterized protein n=1 Tax=Kineosporia babensis TaxID=499548 RepID=A0A9X1N6N2_9ACTN|nr:hypothetical protein [Kineosporia babensis]MCD5309317.1 hypothetical protein [Kineosporia babensis]